MSNYLTKNANILDMQSQWVGDSLIRTVTRHFGKKNKIVVDVTEISPQHTSKQRARQAAINAARRVGCSSVNYIQLNDQIITRKSRNLHTDEPVGTRVRSMTFAFDGVE